MSKIVITGGTGLIGTTLSKLLISNGHSVIILTRSPKPAHDNIYYSVWDVNKSIIDAEVIGQADHIVHLAGAGIADKRWTRKRKAELVNSRVKSSQLIVKTLQEVPNKVQTVVSASATGWYGSHTKGTTRAFVESDPPNSDFLGETCRLWESSIQPVSSLGKRLVILRTGLVLSNNGGAFPEFKLPMKAGIAGIPGSGNQMMSWIHIDDICRLYEATIDRPLLKGVYNAVAPEIVKSKEFIIKTARARKRPFIPIHVPGFAMRIIFGEMSIEVLKNVSVDSNRIRNSGFNFLYPTVDAALNELIKD